MELTCVTGLLNELSDYYEKNGILATNFLCRHKDNCSRGCETFTGPKSAFVSSGYESGLLPRLLFLSLDSGSGDKDDKNRLPHAVRDFEASRDVMRLPKHKHWYRTHELAWYFFKRFNPQLKLEEAKSFFAHANSAKCCMNKPQRKKADRVLFKNCRRYLRTELEILKPEILVTQGNEAKRAILELKESSTNNIDDFASIIELEGNEVFWLHTYHPNCWGAFNKQRRFNKETQVAEGWECYADHIFRFISERHA
jgi:hypothetical protein